MAAVDMALYDIKGMHWEFRFTRFWGACIGTNSKRRA